MSEKLLRRRPIPSRLRYVAGLLKSDANRFLLAVMLEETADEVERTQATVRYDDLNAAINLISLYVPPDMRPPGLLGRLTAARPPLVGAACALRACGDACLEPGCECECHEMPEGIIPAVDVVVSPEDLDALRERLAECGPLSACARAGHIDALDHGPGGGKGET